MTKFRNEGTLGLMIIGGVGLFIGLIAWVQGIGLGKQSYTISVEFADIKGMADGAPLRYRGVEIGKAIAIHPGSKSVLVDIQVTETDLRIPGDSIIEVQSAALLGEKYMDVIMQAELPEDPTLPSPVDPGCNPELIVCDGSKLQGRALPDLADLIRTSYQLSELFTDPLLLATLGQLGESVLTSTSSFSGLGKNVSTLTTSLNGQVGTLGKALTSVGSAADKVGTTAGELQTTVITAREILETNRTVIALTMSNFGTASDDLLTLMDNLNPIVSQVNEGELLGNLQVLSENLRKASAKLLAATNAMSDPSNVQMLQETLDSARVTFQNAQKITTDLEELSGDEKLRNDLRRLLGGLGGLFSRADNLERQVQATQNIMNATTTNQRMAIQGLGSTDWGSWTEWTAELSRSLEVVEEPVTPSEAAVPEPVRSQPSSTVRSEPSKPPTSSARSQSSRRSSENAETTEDYDSD